MWMSQYIYILPIWSEIETYFELNIVCFIGLAFESILNVALSTRGMTVEDARQAKGMKEWGARAHM